MMSALPPKADMCGALAHVRFVTERTFRLYSITSSAVVSSDGGIIRPSVFAVFRLMTNSNFVGCTTGRSAGFSPLRIRPGVNTHLAILIYKVVSVTKKTADFGEFA